MITQQPVRTNTTGIVASLALAIALALGGIGGYAVRGLAQPLSAATARPAIQIGNPSTPGTNGTVPTDVDGPRLTP